MSESRDGDDGTLSPEDLKRLGLAGHGDLSWAKRGFDGFPKFLRALRPSWRGLLGTVMLWFAIEWLGRQLLYILHPVDYSGLPVYDLRDLGISEAFSMIFSGSTERLHWFLSAAAQAPWALGAGALAPPLALVLAVLLLRGAGGRVGRIWAGAIVATAAVTGMGWAAFAPDEKWTRAVALTMAVPNVVVFFFGAAVGAWLLYRATGLARPGSRLTEAAPSLVVVAAIGLNIKALTHFPIVGFQYLFRGPMDPSEVTPRATEFFQVAYGVAEYSVPVLGSLLMLVPALIVIRGLRFPEALRLLGRLASRRPAALAASMLGLVLVALLPIGPLLQATFLSVGILTTFPVTLVDSLVCALVGAIPAGLFIYATALVANALVVSLEADRGRSQTPAGA